MNRMITTVVIALLLLAACSESKTKCNDETLKYPNIIDISFTPDSVKGGRGWFTDGGAWMGFTLPQSNKFTNGFCGPYDLDNRYWVSQSLIQAGFVDNGKIVQPLEFTADSMTYFPGHLYMKSQMEKVIIEQELFFADKNNALLVCKSNSPINWYFKGEVWKKEVKTIVKENSLIIYLPKGEIVAATFDKTASLFLTSTFYNASYTKAETNRNAVITFVNKADELDGALEKANEILQNPVPVQQQHCEKWNTYLAKILRQDTPESYNRIAVKAVVTLLSNWRSSKGDLYHEGAIPSHAVNYFVGFWAWDTWKIAVATARFQPELAKNQIRSMFDYQDDAGMIADCIYSDKRENNYRDSKPPLAAWCVMEVFNQTADTAFIKEMYPKLLKYYQWWYRCRDNDGNGICEYGSTDGTEEAGGWESGMDNAVRFDEAKMIKNSADSAWSFNQESIDLNAYLCYEYELLQQMSALIGEPFNETDHREVVRDYFYDTTHGYFFDKRLKGDFIKVEGPEAWTPLWTKLATPEQAQGVMKIVADTNKFSTYVPFPTLTADHPKFLPDGYWRGPIWLDQVYFGISGIRKYGYTAEADKYTAQVFSRLQGLNEGAPIYENYDTHDGAPLRAPHFSWSSAHLLMMYWELGK